MIHDRGGERRKYQLVDLDSVSWGRIRSKKSQATVTLSGRACAAQASIIDDVSRAARRYEMVIFRGEDRVWEGPIIQARTRRDTATFIANDIKEYLDHTAMSIDWPNADAGGFPLMTDRIEAIINYELSTPYEMRVSTGGAAHVVTVPRWEFVDPPANVLPHLDVRFSDSLLTRSTVVAFQMMVGEHLDNLSEGGLDYTTVGRTLLIWDSATSIGQTRKLTDADFYGDIEVVSAGSEHASIGHISATRPTESADNPLPPPDPGVVFGVGNAGGENDYYGVWTTIHTLEQEEGSGDPSQDELNSQAQRRIVGRTPVPVELIIPDGAGLRLSHDLGINQLVPGVMMPVAATLNLRPVQQDQRLDSLRVNETAAGEAIQVTLVSAGDVLGLAE
jgi:hypothetical protein